VNAQFNDAIEPFCRTIPNKEALFIMRDFIERVGADFKAWPLVIEQHGVGKMNENGQKLLELCSFNNLTVTNTFFQHKDRYKVSWQHPRSKHWHQLDMILTRKRDLNNVKNTRSMHSADCDTDNTIVCSMIHHIPRKMHHTKNKSLQLINASRASIPSTSRDYVTLSEDLREQLLETSPLQKQSRRKYAHPFTNRG
jgi:hypothetical protein